MSALQALVDMVKEAKVFKRNKTQLEGAGGHASPLREGGWPGRRHVEDGRSAFIAMKGLPKPEAS